jgi:hypothetical protein
MSLPEFYLIPKADVTVRDPVSGNPLPAEGANKPRSSYWLRRLRDGDVTEGKSPKAAKAASTPNGEAK